MSILPGATIVDALLGEIMVSMTVASDTVAWLLEGWPVDSLAGASRPSWQLERLPDWQRTWRFPQTCIASMLLRLTAVYRYQAERLEDLPQWHF